LDWESTEQKNPLEFGKRYHGAEGGVKPEKYNIWG
jgi:hypothetical protein